MSVEAAFVVGTELPPVPRVVTREDVRAYAEISGDRNPLHLDDDAARAAGFPGVIAHGMFTMGHLATAISSWVGADAFVRRMRVQFRSPVSIGNTIVAGGRVRSLDAETGTLVLEVWVRIERGAEASGELAIRRGEAEVVLGGA